MINLSPLLWAPAFRDLLLFSHGSGLWNFLLKHINDYHTVLNPNSLTYWQLTPLHSMDILSPMSIFSLIVNGDEFSALVQRQNYSNLPILHFTHHFFAIMKNSNMWLSWALEVGARHWRKCYLLTQYYHVTSVANNIAIPLILVCHCCMIWNHGTHIEIWKKLYIFYLDRKVYNSVPCRPRHNQVVVLCNTFVDILSFLFCSFQLPYN